MKKKKLVNIATGLTFLAPNILGFLAFTLIPLVISFCMAFTDWNLELHNVFRNEPLKFVGFENFKELFASPDFYKFLGNTLFFMMGIPLGVAGSLFAAILLSTDFKGGNNKVWVTIIVTFVLTAGCGMLVVVGLGSTAMTLLICGLASSVLIAGSIGGQTVYRTLFYFPHFTAGVATFLLWKKLYNPETGPINNSLRPILDALTPICRTMSSETTNLLAGLFIVVAILICLFRTSGWIKNWKDGYMSTCSLLIGSLFVSIPLYMLSVWTPFSSERTWLLMPLVLHWVWLLITLKRGRKFETNTYDQGLSEATIFGGFIVVVAFAFIGLSLVVHNLPVMATSALEAPKWLNDYYWAKPSLMIMGFWAAIGSNNMLLYLAGLSGVSQELYEAADIDGANWWQRFWHVTWPQLAPITFFILVMAIIHGLQGGFEMARTMTNGGPFHATTTLSYYIYTEGFSTGRLGFASAVSWVLFALVFSVTALNWKFGNRNTNE